MPRPPPRLTAAAVARTVRRASRASCPRSAAAAPLLLLAHRMRPAHGWRDLDGLPLGLRALVPVSAHEHEPQRDEAADRADLQHRVDGAPRGERMQRGGWKRSDHAGQTSYGTCR